MLSVMARRRGERGAVAIMVAVMMTVFLVLAALVIDLGFARDTRRQSQAAADAAALAAGNVLYPTSGVCSDPLISAPCYADAVSAAKTYSTANYAVSAAAWTSCTDSLHFYVPPLGSQCISFTNSSGTSAPVAKPTKVRVVIPTRDVPTGFGGLVGVSSIPITASARAEIEPSTSLPCGLCVLGSGSMHDLQNGDAYVAGNNVHFNGDVRVAHNGVIITDNPSMYDITVEGTATGSLDNYSPDPTTGVAPIADPLAHIPLPPAMTGLVARTNPCLQGPGIYTSQDLRNSTCTLSAGLYVIRAGVWDLAGNASTNLTGTGVTLYFTCSTSVAPLVPRPCNVGEAGATLDASGSGTVSIQAPTTGPLKGLALLFDRNNTSTIRLTGNGSGGMSGAIYAASASLQMNGNGCASTYDSAVVVRDLEMNGSPSCIRVSYDPNHNPLPLPKDLRLDQ